MKSFLHTARHRLNKLNLQQCRSMCEHMANNVEFLLSIFDSLRMGIIVVDIEGKVRISNKIARVVSERPILPHTYVWHIFREGDLARDIERSIKHKEDFDFREYSLMTQEHKSFSNILGSSHMAKTVRCALLPLVEQKSAGVFLDAGTHAESASSTFPVMRVEKKPVIQTIVTGSVICLEDVSAEREVAQKTYRDKSFTSMKNVTAGIAHEIKNPLSAISLHLALLRKKIQGAEKNLQSETGRNKALKYIEIIEDEIQTMDKIVSVFLNDFTIQNSDLEPKDMAQLLLEVLRFVQPDLKQRRIGVVKHFQNAVPRVLMSMHAMTHVVLNIIKNAIDAMDSGGKIYISTDCSDGKVRAIISDTGPGINEEVQKNIFDPYFTTKSKGSGIGLTIAHKLVRVHGGNLELDVSYTKGARFIISLPAYADEHRLLSNE